MYASCSDQVFQIGWICFDVEAGYSVLDHKGLTQTVCYFTGIYTQLNALCNWNISICLKINNHFGKYKPVYVWNVWKLTPAFCYLITMEMWAVDGGGLLRS